MPTIDHLESSTRPAGLKPLLVRSLLACMSGTAALAIYAVLTASFDETAARVLGSTLLVGLCCVLCLACLTVLGGRCRAVGVGGMVAAVAALGCGLALIWELGGDWGDDSFPLLVRGFLICAVLAFALAHAALLLRLTVDGFPGLRATVLVCLSMVATMLIVTVISEQVAATDGYWRLLGVLAILDVLGSICLPVLARLERNSAR